MSELTYTRCGDYYIPDLKLSEQPEAPIGKYGRMRQRYLKEHRPGLYSSLILSEKLYPHLLEIDRAARERMDAMLPRMMEATGVTEELKARDPMALGGADEHAESAGGGSYSYRADLSIVFASGGCYLQPLFVLHFRHIFCLAFFELMKYNERSCRRCEHGLHDTQRGK